MDAEILRPKKKDSHRHRPKKRGKQSKARRLYLRKKQALLEQKKIINDTQQSNLAPVAAVVTPRIEFAESVSPSCTELWDPSKVALPAEKSSPVFEPEILIKEEPIDIDEEQLPSTSATSDEFILPCRQTTPSTPALGMAFTVCKTEAPDEPEEDTRTSNGKHKATKRKAGKVEVEQSEMTRDCEDDSPKDRPKDDFDAYGEYIAAKLRKLDWKSCAYVQKAIGDIIFEAEMGKYK